MINVSRQCEHPKTELRTKTASNGVKQYRYQCLTCGGIVGPMAISHVEAMQQLGDTEPNEFDDQLKANWFKERNREKDEEYRRRQANWRAQYDEYIHSDLWARRREKILIRDCYKCQACLSNKATQVHHLTYKNIRNEFAFELISVCNACHERIHALVFTENFGGPQW